MSKRAGDLIPFERVERAILLLRGHKVLDTDFVGLYGVAVSVLNQAVTRNLTRFPSDFMFQLTAEVAESLRSQTVILKTGPLSPTRRGALKRSIFPSRMRK